MNRKELQEFLNNFPEDAEICTETNNHYSFDGITRATLIDTKNDGEILFIGNCTQLDRHGYNVTGESVVKAWSLYNGFNSR